MFVPLLSFISSTCIREENERSIIRGDNWPQMWEKRASVTSDPAQLTFLSLSFLQSLLGFRIKASETQCDLPSCLCPFLAYQGKNSSQVVREIPEQARRLTVPPNFPKFLIVVRCEEIKTLIPEDHGPTHGENQHGQELRIGADWPCWSLALSSFPMAHTQ